jgi:hypothetical protein
MAINQPDRPLRLMITRLRKLSADDCGSILDQLDDGQKARVESLLVELKGSAADHSNDYDPIVSFDPVIIPVQISPWLSARINGYVESGEETSDPFSLTSHAHSALRRCAAAMVPATEKIAKRPSLLDLLWSKRA